MTTGSEQQKVVVTDIHMPFGSMIVFMVKWAVASIPALIILVVLGAVFWGVTIGLVSSMGNSARQSTSRTSTAPTTTHEPVAAAASAEEAAYLGKVIVRNVTVGKSVLDEPGAFGEVKNTGDRILKRVEITVLCLGPDGKAVFEKTYDPVWVTDSGYGDRNQPLKPGYSRQFGVKLDDAPSEWSKKVDIKVSKVEFQ